LLEISGKGLHKKSQRVVEVKEPEEQDMDWQEEEQVETDPQEVPRKGFFYEVRSYSSPCIERFHQAMNA